MDILGTWERHPLVQTLMKKVGFTPAMELLRAGKPVFDAPFKGLSILLGGNGIHRRGLETFLEGQKARLLETAQDSIGAVIYDATHIDTPTRLDEVYHFFNATLGLLEECGRIVIVGHPVAALRDPTAYACQHSLQGLVRSLAKEVGRKGITAQLIYAGDTEAARSGLYGTLQFLLTPRAAFISGQVLEVSPAVVPSHYEISPRLENKTIVVTGAASGIGLETTRRLGAYGAKVVAVDLPQNEAALKRAIKGIPGEILALDITEADAPEKLVVFGEKITKGFDAVVHNAGITRDKTMARMAAEQWHDAIETNFSAITRLDELVLARKVLRPEGRLIYLSSISGIAGNFGQTNYATSKSAVIGYMKAMSCRAASERITANAIAPGFIETPMTAQMPWLPREIARRFSALGQGGLPIDVAEAVAFLASSQGAGLTGSVLRVCGGSFFGA